MFLIITFMNHFSNVKMFTFLELFGWEHKFETCFDFLIRI